MAVLRGLVSGLRHLLGLAVRFDVPSGPSTVMFDRKGDELLKGQQQRINSLAKKPWSLKPEAWSLTSDRTALARTPNSRPERRSGLWSEVGLASEFAAAGGVPMANQEHPPGLSAQRVMS